MAGCRIGNNYACKPATSSQRLYASKEHRHIGPVELFSMCKEAIMNSQSTTGAGIPAPSSQRNPGDESAPGTPQTAEDICPECQGSGKQGQGACANCGGTGRIVKIIGDA
jgi:hypothetical protein